MPVDPAGDFGKPDFGREGVPFDPTTHSTVQDPATDYGREGNPHPVYEASSVIPGVSGGGVVIFMMSL